MNWKDCYLAFIPPLLIILSYFTNFYGISLPLVLFLALYVISVSIAKYRCKDMKIKDIMKKVLIPLIPYILLTVVAIVARLSPGGALDFIDPFTWLLFGFLYKYLFDKIFSC